MTIRQKWCAWGALAAMLAGPVSTWAQDQNTAQSRAQNPGQDTPQTPAQSTSQTDAAPNRITAAQARELFASVDTILQFASDDSKLAIRHKVKRRLTTRDAVEKYLVDKMKDDKDAKRMQRSEIVLKKFGLLDRDFVLQPFLVSLLKEQIAGYYDSKTKTVNLLDWIAPDAQKPVLAHELTHALQDQRVGLDKWEDTTSEDLARNVKEDNQHIATDEQDTAREAVLEGQAMAVLVDYSLKPAGQSILSNPAAIKQRADEQSADSDSPVMQRAPLVLQESMLFPYRDGLKFEVDVLKDQGVDAAFAGALDRPPATSFEIMNPRAYESRAKLPLLAMPDIHGLIDADYDPYDVGVMGQLDVRMMAELFGGPQVAAALTPAWDGGIYYVAQKKSAPDKSLSGSVSLLYLSQWRSPAAAAVFAKMYADELGNKYSGVKRDTRAEADQGEQIYQTSEGPVLLATKGNLVFVSESFDLALARKLEFSLTGAQAASRSSESVALNAPAQDLTGSLTSFFARCGIMRSALHLY
jgi:hypothetical protein